MRRLLLSVGLLLWLSGCTSTVRFSSTELSRFRGFASFYGREFAGRPTASGEIYAPEALTAAHRTLPFGTRLRVTNLRNGRSVIVRINDRGPQHPERVIDLSEAAARALEMLREGVVEVECEVLR
ncbi:MAG: septal ring lytic transglycosylase RlpA family protein [Candidatus Kapabacteria bacterium]|nr:septal ring lytic transglycosylase RlpA family protein [Candidatus Kapabacteria bacterium]MDW7997168.1 septal ring lytic transglycosylase RlpA family protein [Bacteroidota bacterium]MDW8225558.1 septal ring lytic transglycosylase RlpA family protein [Bacteroidota bacterium]